MKGLKVECVVCVGVTNLLKIEGNSAIYSVSIYMINSSNPSRAATLLIRIGDA